MSTNNLHFIEMRETNNYLQTRDMHDLKLKANLPYYTGIDFLDITVMLKL